MRKTRTTTSHGGTQDTGNMWRESRLARVCGLVRVSGKRMVMAAVLAGATGAIIFNAVVLQPTRHPAPLFAAVDAARAVQEKPVALVSHPLPPSRPAQEQLAARPAEERAAPKSERASIERAVEKYERPAEKIDKLLEKVEKVATKPAAMPVAQAKPPARSSGDALGEFIRAGAVPPASIPNEPDARLMTIQKNLQRLGYAVGKPDGMMGSGTRAAIEKFERDRKWPVTGEVSQKLVRELGTVSAGKRD